MLDEDSRQKSLLRCQSRPKRFCVSARPDMAEVSPSNSQAAKISGRVTNTESKASSATWLERTSNLPRNCCQRSFTIETYLHQISLRLIDPSSQHRRCCFSDLAFSISQPVAHDIFPLCDGQYPRVWERCRRQRSMIHYSPQGWVGVSCSSEDEGQRGRASRQIIQCRSPHLA